MWSIALTPLLLSFLNSFPFFFYSSSSITLLESSLFYHSHLPQLVLFSLLLLLGGLLMDVGKIETTSHHQKQRAMEKEKVKKEAVVGDEDGEYDEDKKRKGVIVGGGSGKKPAGGGGTRCCQAEKCTADLSEAKPYHRRHKVCEIHAKSQVVLVGGIRQRFCQQCSRFHELSEFDEAKRSCRRRLAGHNERRRKISAESNAECSIRKGTGTHMKDSVCGQVDDKGRIQMTIQENAAYKHFQIR